MPNGRSVFKNRSSGVQITRSTETESFIETSLQWRVLFYAEHALIAVLIFFIRATLCIARSLPSCGVCLSVRSSVTHAGVVSKRINIELLTAPSF